MLDFNPISSLALTNEQILHDIQESKADDESFKMELENF